MTTAVIPIAAAVAGALTGAAAGALLAPKPASYTTPKVLPLPTRNMAASAAIADTEFRRRRGYAANILTSPSGAEAPSPGGKSLLGQ